MRSVTLKYFASRMFLVLPVVSILHAQDPGVQNIINSVKIDSLVYFVKELSGEVSTMIDGSPYTIQSRHKNQPGNNKAATYIKQKLDYYGLTTYDQNFSSTGRNVYGVQLGTEFPNQKYIICAHYDSYTPSGTIAPGADDNASGTAAVIEAARIFSNYTFPFTIIYALWDEEEQGLVGSNYFATQARNQGEDIIAVINLDMIAYDSNNDNVAEIHTRPIDYSVALKDKMVEVNSTYGLGVTLNIIDPGLQYSDHYPFWLKNYSAILLIEQYYGDFNAYYHTINDLLIHFNQSYFLKLSILAFGTLAALALSDEPLPVELTSFMAVYKNSTVILSWKTETEVNNFGFEIERTSSISKSEILNSPEGMGYQNFQKIGFVQGHGNSNSPKEYQFTDDDLTGRGYIFQYRLKQIDNDGTYGYSNQVEVEIPISQYLLLQNFPNPFNPSTRIGYFVPKKCFVSLKVYDFLGREVVALVNENKIAGSYEIVFDASGLPSGTYFYNMVADDYLETKKMILIK